MGVLSERLRALRGSSSQAEMARQLGMKQPQWARYESGASSPSSEILATICRVHACSADWLLGLDRGNSAAQVKTGNNSAVAIGVNARATVRGTFSERGESAAPGTPGEMPACARCPVKKRLEKIEKMIKGA